MPEGSSKCIEGEIPFDVPDSWAWCRIAEISSIVQFGLSNSAETSGNYRLLRITDIQDNMVEWSNVPYTNIDSIEAATYLLEKGDILFARTGATVGKSYLISELPVQSVFASYLIRVKLLNVNSQYVKYFFESLQYWEQITNKSVGIGQPNVNGTKLKEIILPLPPLAEQERLVKAIVSAFAVIDEIEHNKSDLQAAVVATKSKILSLAIRGKLVPQDPEDEPASVLLGRIQAEKESLIKQGKIKRDKSDSAVVRGDDNSYYENLPFELPETWSWVQLGEICDYGSCDSVSADNIPDDAWILDLEDIEKDTAKVLEIVHKHERPFTSTKHSFLKGQVLYSKLRPYLNKVIIAPEDGYCTSEILPMLFSIEICSEYVRIFLMSNFFLSYANHCSYGVKMPRLGTTDGKKARFALPPLSEQQRIARAVTEVFGQLDLIVENLN